MFQRSIFALSCLIAVTSIASAQMRGGGMGAPPHFTPGFAGGGFGGHFGRLGYGSGFVYLGDPFLYADYPGAPVVYQSPPPQVIVVQQPSQTSAAAEKQIDPLLIELQGDRYVRFVGEVQPTSEHSQGRATSVLSSVDVLARPSASSSPRELPPAVLVYRDGHREEVNNYAIVSGVLYAQGNYWQDGYWTKNIQLAALDIPATMRANQENGTKFVLPSGPNEVVVRP